MFLTAARLDAPPHRLPPHLAELPVVTALAASPLEFTTPVTVLTGENGAGKSTLMEALAVGMGLNPEGGSRHARFSTTPRRASVSPLYRELTLSRASNPVDAFFLRGEAFYNLAQYYAGLEPPPSGPPMDELLQMSHGQSLTALLRRRFHTDGLFFLDEPEAGLSVLRQLEFMGELSHLAEAGSQIILATHSPVLLATPGATILEISGAGVHGRDFEDTEAVRAAREFVADPTGTAAFLTGEDT